MSCLILIVMRKLLLIFVFLLLLQIDVHATMFKYDHYGSISYNDLDINSPSIIIDTPLYVSDIRNINNDGYWEWEWENTVSDSNVRPSPEPATLFLLGSGLVVFAWSEKKR
jgi:hypothetical protein